jgi:uncharacterized membrane protein
MGSIVIQPNRPLGTRGTVLFFLTVAAPALAVAVTFALIGLWPVLPFTGLELLLLGGCLYAVQRRSRYREVIRFDEDAVILERGRGRPVESVRFRRPWVRLEQEPPPNRHYPSRLFLREGVERMEIGRCLTEAERESLRERLEELLSTGGHRA